MGINSASGPSWIAAWRNRGLHAFLCHSQQEVCIERRFSPLVRALSCDYRVFGSTHATLLCCLSLILVQEFEVVVVSLSSYAADLEAAADFIEEVVGSLSWVIATLPWMRDQWRRSWQRDCAIFWICHSWRRGPCLPQPGDEGASIMGWALASYSRLL